MSVVANDNFTRVRLDKWLWAARFFKTRALAAENIGHGRVAVNGQVAKASRELHAGDRILLRQNGLERELLVRALSGMRGPAVVAQTLYEETADSLAKRQLAAEARRLAPEPGQTVEQGRPTKRDRRELERTQATWQRWSASIDDERR
jgi:ribosome-associated heat shock protein Hsp15